MYDFKVIPEALRAGAFALLVFAATLLVNLDLEAVTGDWKAWAIAAGSGAAAAAGAAILGVLTRGKAS